MTMRPKKTDQTCWETAGGRASYAPSIENMKRRRALMPSLLLDEESQLFFERVLNVRKLREMVIWLRPRPRRH